MTIENGKFYPVIRFLTSISYSLSAGFALGLVNLGRGNTIPAKNEMNIDELLLNYINGGKKRKDKYMYMPGYADEFKNSNVMHSYQKRS